MPSKKSTYDAGANLTYELVGRFKIFGSGVPEFWFPPPEIALLASLFHVGKKLAHNDAARELLKQLFEQCDRRKLDDYPTAMMLLTCLEMHGIPVKHVPFEELGINAKLVTKGGSA
jgi:hypothetical protein